MGAPSPVNFVPIGVNGTAGFRFVEHQKLEHLLQHAPAHVLVSVTHELASAGAGGRVFGSGRGRGKCPGRCPCGGKPR